MRHAVDKKKFSRSTKQRKALFLSLICPLIEKGAIVTTLAKAKAIKRITEKLVTAGKKKNLTGRRSIQALLRKRRLTNIVVDEIAPLFDQRPGGYLRIIHLPPRKGDSAPMAKIEFIDYPKEAQASEIKKQEVEKIIPEEKVKTDKPVRRHYNKKKTEKNGEKN